MDAKKIIKKIKNDSKFLMLIMIIVAFLFLVASLLLTGLVFNFVITLVLWIVFILIYTKFLFDYRFSIRISMFAILFFISGIILFYTANNDTNNKKLVSCTSTNSDKPSKVDGWETNLFSADWANENMPDPLEKSTQKKSYSLATVGKDRVANIFYQVEKSDQSYLPTDTRRIVEVCDVNNKTYQYNTTDTATSGTSEGVVASETLIFKYNVNINSVPGDFRVDGYLFTNGKWTLTDRIENVRIER